jgi:hypothetical protein
LVFVITLGLRHLSKKYIIENKTRTPGYEYKWKLISIVVTGCTYFVPCSNYCFRNFVFGDYGETTHLNYADLGDDVCSIDGLPG